MGMSLQFYAGDKDVIIDAVAFEELDELEELEDDGLSTDFRLHLQPQDLNPLIQLVSGLYGDHTFGLKEKLDTRDYYFDAPDRGAFYIEDSVKEVFAQCDLSMAAGLANSWYKKLKEVHPNLDLAHAADAVAPIRELIRICQVATKEDYDLVHVWYGNSLF